MTHSAWWLVVNILAVYRASILFSRDKITSPLRWRVWALGYEWKATYGDDDPPKPGRRYRQQRPGLRGRIGVTLNELIICPWCLSIWFGLLAAVATKLVPGLWQYPALVLALSGVTVLWTRIAPAE